MSAIKKKDKARILQLLRNAQFKTNAAIAELLDIKANE